MIINVYKTCDECSHRKKKYTEAPCKACYTASDINKRPNWSPKNLLVWFLAWMED